MERIILGTAQFGMDYGISNVKGQVQIDEVNKILNYASNNQIKYIDTAYSYGKCETIIGEFINNYPNNFSIISKFPKKYGSDPTEIFLESLKRLNQKKIYAYLIHEFNTFKKDKSLYDLFVKLKGRNKIEKIGFSIYYTEELEYLLNNKIAIDIIQVPYNIFDRRFEPYFKLLRENGVEIHVRSVFLQGLFFMNPSKLSSHFNIVVEKLKFIKNLSDQKNLEISSICLNYVMLNEFINNIIIGVTSLKELKDNISNLYNINIVRKYIDELDKLRENDLSILIPSKWEIE